MPKKPLLLVIVFFLTAAASNPVTLLCERSAILAKGDKGYSLGDALLNCLLLTENEFKCNDVMEQRLAKMAIDFVSTATSHRVCE